MFEVTVISLAFLVSWFVTSIVLRYALLTGLLDFPNPRSSHLEPTPSGGGIAIVVAVLLTSIGLSLAGFGTWQATAVCCGPGVMVALVGYADDRQGLSARIRFLVHMVAAGITVSLAWPFPALANAGAGIQVLWVLVSIVGIAWMINLYNFMDGVDGLAGSQATFVFGAAGVLTWLADGPQYWIALLSAVASSAVGFLWWNRPPARIFMGDVGSGFIGFLIAGFALLTWREGLLPLATWAILVSLFVADATVTLIRRMIRREKWYAAHRSHAYQRLARSSLGHSGVTLLSWAWNLVVVTPVAYWSTAMPQQANVFAIALVSISVALVLILGAGRAE